MDKALYLEALPSRNWWQPLALGVGLVLAGGLLLFDASGVTVFSAIVVGTVLLVIGLFEVLDSLWVPHWSGLVWRVMVGALYAIGGLALLSDPVAASHVVSAVVALSLLTSGAARMYFAVQERRAVNLLLFTSGVVGALAGLLIAAKWPAISPLAAFGFLIGIDLVLHGAWWILLGWAVRHEPRSP
jgi:uncharacterized membrane protein HdeD (DUF308 family)